jgi:hypothetical protein
MNTSYTYQQTEQIQKILLLSGKATAESVLSEEAEGSWKNRF